MSELDGIIAAYLSAIEEGENPDRRELLERHPDLAGELESFFESHDEIRGLTGVVDSDTESTGESTFGKGDSVGKTLPLLGTADSPSVIRRVGSYEILQEIDRGGMGIVYRAFDTDLNRTVALKMIRSGRLASDSDVQRFRAEAQAAAQLDHPGIVSIYDVGTHEGHPYFSMAFIEGENLENYLENREVSIEQACQLIRSIALAIDHAHEHDLVHRDLKPANILVDKQGQPRITDFGLAKQLGKDDGLTGSGEILGTINFMAPEQAAARNDQVSRRTDIYSLGAMLYFLCTGRPPFETDNPVDTLLRILDSEPELISRVNSNVPNDLALICMRCLEKDPRERYQTARELADELDRFLMGEPINASTSGMQSRIRKWARREPALVGHLVGLGVIESTRLVSYAIEVIFFGGLLPEYLRFTYVLIGWAVACIILQKIQNASRRNELIKYIWAAADIAFLTLILLMAEKNIGPLFITYPLVIVVSSLFLQVRMVVVTTCLCLVSFVYVYAVTTPQLEYGHYGVVGVAAIVSIGFAVNVLVHRIRNLNRLFE